jgi:hypothetical protein
MPTDDYSSNLGYNLRLGTTPGGSELSNTLTNSNGERLINQAPPIYINSFETQLPPGKYYFSVQAIDQGLKGGVFSDEKEFTLTYEWRLLNQGGIVDRSISGKSNPILKLGDIDNDNDLDLIYGSSSSGTTEVLKFDGKKLIKDNSNPLQNASNITDAQIGDINGDGTPDILLNNFSNNSTNNLQVFISNGNGYDNVNLGSGLYNAKGRVVDLNNDGQAEVTLIGVSSTTTSGIPKFYTYEYDKSSKGFKEKKDLSSQIASLKYASFDLGDVDNDLDIDFLISGFDESNGLESYLYENTSTIGEDYQLTETNNNLVAIRDGTVDFIDFDSDGDLDAVFSGTGLQGDVFEIYRNDLSEGTK